MSEVVGEVADGFLGHSLTTARYLDEVILPAVARGRAKSGRTRRRLRGERSAHRDHRSRTTPRWRAVAETARSSIAFYLSTPAYRGMLEVFGWGDRQDELTRLSKQGEWDAMTKLVDDEMLDTFTIWAEPDAVAAKVVARFGGRYDRVSFTPDMGVPPRSSTRSRGRLVERQCVSRGKSAMPSTVVATVLFTDLVESTAVSSTR